MPSKASEKNKESNKELETKISPILVINNSSLKPYVELFEYQPENIYQQPLGTLVGFFEIKEYSEDSAYIVNFLTSVLKKEYYANAKRSIEESFDAALHKVNLALSELAKHGNIEWLGKLNASICVLEKSGAHFSVSGNARMFLWRAGALSDISEGLATDETALHPLKTFLNVSSGRLEKNDRLFITSDDLFQIMTQNELIKNFQRLEKEKFVQFLKTACSNQLEMIASIVVDIQEPVISEARAAAPHKKKNSTGNVFSKAAFEESDKIKAEKSNRAIEENLPESEPASDYTDKKTGHIYVQGENQSGEESGVSKIYLEIAKEKIASGWYHTKSITRRRFVLYKKRLAKSFEEMRQRREARKIELQKEKLIQEETRAKEQEELDAQFEKQSREEQKEAARQQLEEKRRLEVRVIEEIQIETIEEEIIPEELKEAPASQETEPLEHPGELSFAEKLARAKQFQTIEEKTSRITQEEIYVEYSEDGNIGDSENPTPKEKVLRLAKNIFAATAYFSKKIFTLSLQYIQTIKSKIGKEDIYGKREHSAKIIASESVIVPKFSAIKGTYSRLTGKQKTGALVALVLIFVIPIFIAKWLSAPKPATVSQTQQPADPSAIYANDKNINLRTQSTAVLKDPTLLTTLITTSGPVAVTKSAVIMSLNSSPKNYPFPANSGSAVRATYMSDLNQIFILTDSGSVISFAPSVQKYSSNNINLAGISSSSLIGTYLTYLYVLDQKSSQIYRYPRSEGGFSNKTAWLKDGTSISNATDMTMDDHIYVAQGGHVIELFKGTSTPINFEASNTPVQFDHIYTTTDITSFYAIDNKNTRLVQYNKASGSIIAQYYNTDLANTTSFSVDEQNKVAYVTTPSGLISISLQ